MSPNDDTSPAAGAATAARCPECHAPLRLLADDPGMPWETLGKPLPPAATPPERLAWRLMKDGRIAEATIRAYPHGDEIFITVGDEFLTSSLHRNDAAGLNEFSTGIRQTFIAKGWA